MTNLRLLYLTKEMLKDQSKTNLEKISTLIDDLPRLGCLGFSELNDGHYFREYKPQTPETVSFIPRKLMQNRLRVRLASLNATDPVAAWPLILKLRALQFTRRYDCGYYNRRHYVRYDAVNRVTYPDEGVCWCCGCASIRQPSFTIADALL